MANRVFLQTISSFLILASYTWSLPTVGSSARNLVSDIRRAEVADLCFVVDCTGSMGPYIDGVRDAILDIVSNISGYNTEAKIEQLRLAFVGYRDSTDDPEFAILPFTKNITLFREFIKNVEATGGGDLPENVPGGLQKALQLDWLEQAGTRVLFHMGDEPCHTTEIEYGNYFASGPLLSFESAVGDASIASPMRNILVGPALPVAESVGPADPNVAIVKAADKFVVLPATTPIKTTPKPPTDIYCLALRDYPTEKTLFQQINAKQIEYNFGAITHDTDAMLVAFETAYGRNITQFDVGISANAEYLITSDLTGDGMPRFPAASGAVATRDRINFAVVNSVNAANFNAKNSLST